MNNSLSAIVSAFQSLREQQIDLVMATLIEAHGSSYRRPGAIALINPDGEFYGLLGDTELHTYLKRCAQQVFDTGEPLVVCYSPLQQQSTRLRILLQHLTIDNDYKPFSLISERVLKQQSDVLVTVYESENEKLSAGTTFFNSAPENVIQQLSQDLSEEIQAICQQQTASSQALCCEHFLDSESLILFYSCIAPATSLLIFGSGPDTLALIHFAKQLGWYVVLADHPELLSERKCFEGADEVIPIDEATRELPTDLAKASAIVVMSHNSERDQYFLSLCENSQAPYIGLLASKKRGDKLFKAAEIINKSFHARLYHPAGLTPGGELPEEIALSILAQIQQVLYSQAGVSTIGTDISHDTKLLEKLAVVILAAGGSERFGGVKQLLEYKGTSLLRRSAETAKGLSLEQVYAVLGPKQLKMERELSTVGIEVLANPNWQSGQSSSIKVGLQAISSKCEAVLFMLVDQPLIHSDNLKQLISLWLQNRDKIICSEHSSIRTEPVIVPRKYFPEISKLYKDQGIRRLLETQNENCMNVAVPEAAMDINTQDDYMRLLREVDT